MSALDTCHYCGGAMHAPGSPRALADRKSMRTRDHKIPTCVGGSGEPRNVVMACARCNEMKGDTPYEVFVFFMRQCGSDTTKHPRQYRAFCHDLSLAGFRAIYAVTAREKRLAVARETATLPKAPQRALEENKAYALHRASKRRQRAIMFDKRA